jgi:hypothetical protein
MVNVGGVCRGLLKESGWRGRRVVEGGWVERVDGC